MGKAVMGVIAPQRGPSPVEVGLAGLSLLCASGAVFLAGRGTLPAGMSAVICAVIALTWISFYAKAIHRPHLDGARFVWIIAFTAVSVAICAFATEQTWNALLSTLMAAAAAIPLALWFSSMWKE
ncbi:hypothetical protein SAMN05421595_0297 [Austwickia chelonae]|uniref:Uncharacterized protein n=1 Tax=Austwickia chelonae NBRC 105200 TaxID=1184607 RepID=K6VQZ1_9MICO|nr:hypothetical protein [Austwickia chelonae]GAB77790.1 hypothetical protein AUCHE_08_00290 [Austwickia chelonae NBRC 105200]SEV89556.1 hypothetical protein SAMN05421595_0297 [Austwickia chelonae]